MKVISNRWSLITSFTVVSVGYRSDMTWGNLEVLNLFQNADRLELENFNFLSEPQVEPQFPITSIKELTLTISRNFNYLLSILTAFPYLKSLRSTFYDCGKLLNQKEFPCRSLESLVLNSSPSDGLDSIVELEAILNSCSNLKKIKLNVFHFVTKSTLLISIINKCSQLQYIHLSNECDYLYFDFSKFINPMPSLKYLKLTKYLATPDSLALFLGNCPKLKYLNFPANNNLEITAIFKAHHLLDPDFYDPWKDICWSRQKES